MGMVGFERWAAAAALLGAALAQPAQAGPAEHEDALRIHADALFKAGDFAASTAAWEDAAEIERRHGAASAGYIDALTQLGATWVQRGEPARAEAVFRKALPLAQATLGESHPGTITLMTGIAGALRSQDRNLEAAPIYARALGLARQALPAASTQITQLLLSYASSLADSGRLAEADPVSAEALRRTSSEFEPGMRELVLTQSERGSLLLRLGRPAEARPLFETALETGRKRLGARHPQVLEVANNLAALLLSIDDNAAAEPILREVEAARIAQLPPGARDRVIAVNNLATLLMKLGRYGEAAQRLAALEKEDARTRDPRSPVAIQLALNLAVCRLFGAQAATAGKATDDLTRAMTDPGAALDPARRAFAGQTARLARLGAGPAAEAQLAREQAAAPGMAALFIEAAWFAAAARPGTLDRLQREAFIALQQGMAGPVNAAIQRQAALRLAADAGPDLGGVARERQDLADRWTAKSAELAATQARSDADAQAARDTLGAELAQIGATIAADDARLAREAPAYVALTRPRPLTADEASGVLAPDEALVLILPTPFATHVMVVTRTGLSWFRSSQNAEAVAYAVRRLLWFAGAPVLATAAEAAEWTDAVPGDNGFDRKLAFAVWEQLLKPAAGDLADKHHVLIAPGGSLASMPFSLLVTAEPQGADDDPAALRATHWLGDAFALSQVPSLQSLAVLRKSTGRTAPSGFSGWGDPVLQGNAETRGGAGRRGAQAPPAARLFSATRNADGAVLADVSQLQKLARLPGTARELAAMAQAFAAPTSALHLGPAATETALRQADLSHVAILALATHGLTAGELPGAAEPALVLTPPPTPTAGDDGLLTASEVAALRLDADWVILSACNTAAGDGSAGAPGLSGLARAFFFAGARSLLVSHWPVRDDVAAKLTVRTIEIARDNPALTRAAALAQAMKEIRDNPAADAKGQTWASPNAWAPFSLIGDGAR